MRRKTKLKILAAVAVSSMGTLPFAHPAHAANGLWISNATSGGLWSNTANWNGGIVASGTDAIATFNTPSVVNVVNLDAPFTVGGLNFNTTSTANTWNISNNGISTNILTLATSTGVPKINVLTLNSNQSIGATIAGTQGFTKSGAGSLILTGSNTYSGVTTLNSTTNATGADLYLGNNNALGTSSLFIDPGTANNLRVLLNAGVVIPNAITINTSRAAAGANSSLMTNGNVAGAGFSGPITINTKAGSGGHISGPADPTLTSFLTVSGPIYLSAAYNAGSGNLANASGNGLLLRSGNYIFSGGGSYFRAEVRSGELRDGANNGIATNAYIDIAGNATTNGNPLLFGILDLAGFNQTLVGIQDQVNNSPLTGTVTNSNASSPSTLTLTPISAANNPNEANLNFTSGGNGQGTTVTITDTGTAGAFLNIVINGDAAGIQTFNTPSSSYHGSTTLTSGILAVDSLANGGSNSGIGAASNAASNLVFNGGTLRYTSTTSTSTDHDWTTNSTATFDIAQAVTTLTMTSGGGLGGTGSGGMTKLGAGTLLFTGVNTYTGPTVISAGKLLVDGSLTAGSNLSIASGATFGGTGTAGGTVTPAVGGIIAPGDPATNTGVGTLTVGTLNLSAGAILNFELTGGSGNDEIIAANLNVITGATVDLYQPGTTTTFSTNGIYPLFNVSGAVTGSLNSIFVATPAAGKSYTLINSSGIVNLTIASGTTIEWNDNNGDTNWPTGGNWIGGTSANGIGQTALFGANLVGSNGTVTLTSPETVSGIAFNNSGVSYNLGGTSALTLNNGVAAASVDIINGSHSINVPISLGSAVALNTTNTSDVLTISGNITGARAVSVTGPGTVTLTGSNGFTTTSITNSTLNVGTGTTGTLGTGAVTLAGNATLNFNSNINYNFGQPITGAGSINQMGSNILTVGTISSINTLNVSNGSLVGTSISQSGGINITGSGSLTASGAVTGLGKLTVNTSGAVSLGAADAYGGGTEVDQGTLTLNASGALPNNSALAVNGGTLDLHGNSIAINNVLDTTGSTGLITNSVAATTATIAFSGSQAQYNIYSAINDGPSGGKIALTSFIDNTNTSQNGSDNQFALTLNATSNYSGGTTVNKQSIGASATNAFGTGPITLTLNNTSTNNTRIYVKGGISLPNNITIAQPNAFAGFGVIQYLSGSTGSVTLTGTITQQANPFSGGTFAGPASTTTDVLNVNGPILATGTATTISSRGNMGFGGGGSYANLNVSAGTAFINAPNGISSGAALYLNTATVDLNGNNQTVAGLNLQSGSGKITNSSVTPATFTVNNALPNSFAGGTITGNLSLVKSGSSSLFVNGSSNYSGSTIISGGTLRLGPITQPSLVAAYSFDNTTATPVGTPTTITNSGTGGAAMNGSVNQTGGANVTIVAGGPTINGVSGNALNFDGTGGAVIIPSPVTDLSGTGSWTLSAWLNTSQSGSTILSKNSGGWAAGNSVFYLGNGASGSGTEPAAVRNGGGFETGSGVVSDGTWHMVTFVDKAGAETVYIDGVATTPAQTGFTTADVGSEIELGLTTDTVTADGTANMNGLLDDINIFSGALTPAQITSLFTTNVAGALPPSYVLPSTTALNLNASGAVLDLNGNAQAVASLTGVAGTQVTLGGGTLLVGDSTSTTFAGSITDAGGTSNLTGGSLVKQGSGTLTLSGINSYSGNTIVNAGLLVAANGLSSVGTSTIVINGGGMILQNTSSGSVNALLKTGYNAGAWNGTGINSAAAASDSTHLHAVGMLQPATATLFEGQPLGTGDVALKYTYYGDANLDGKVDGSDYSRIDTSFLAEKTGPAVTGWYNGDFNYDGVVNGSDYTLIDNAFNSQGAAIASQLADPSATATADLAGSGTSSAVPEPTALGLLALTTAGLLGRRRRV